MHFNTLFRSERGLPGAMALVFLPWLVVVLCTGGPWVAISFLGYASLVTAAGYGIVSLTLPARLRTEAIELAPAAGILAISAITGLWVRLGLHLVWVAVPWIGLVAVGAAALWIDRAPWAKRTVAYGGLLASFSAIICLVYFVPGARNDGVERRNGSFNWTYVDTQYFHSMASAVKSSDGQPRDPGSATQELLYHFGAYAPAAVLSRFTGLGLGDTLVRITRSASLWSLFWSSLGLGTLLSLRATRERFGGLAVVVGLFFYGSLLALFTDEANSASHVTGAILFKIPGIAVQADGGPFSHLILGHSMLHGLGAITAIMGLCLVRAQEKDLPAWRELILLLLPALAVPVNSVAALYCLGVVGILLFWGRLNTLRSWLLILLLCSFFFASWRIMGYGQASDSALASIQSNPAGQWWAIAVAFIVGLGFRIVAFQWISAPWKDPFAALVLATVLGLLAFSTFLQIKGQERYGIEFLQCIFSIFAFSRLRSGWWRLPERARWSAEWLVIAQRGMVLLAACGVLFSILVTLTHTPTGVPFFRVKVALWSVLLVLLLAISALMKRSHRFASISSAVIMCVLLFGFSAWLAPWFNFGLGRMRMDITLRPGEVQGLSRLRALAAPGDRFATNKHAIESVATHPERSYAYGALAERPVLLEGYLYRESALPGFQALLRDNDLMFSATNPQIVRNLAKAWHVHWLVARPGTDIALSRPLPAWLVPQQRCGDLKIYRID